MTYYDDEALGRITRNVASKCLADTIGADTDDRKAGEGWYYVAHEIAEAIREAAADNGHAYTLQQVADVIAVLSPMTRWWQNLQAAESIIVDDDPDAALDHCFSANVSKALGILDEHDRLSGPKVTAFAECIADPSHSTAVVIDTWMLRAFGLTQLDYARKGVYEAVAQGVRLAARKLSLQPHQVQAIVWIATRGKA